MALPKLYEQITWVNDTTPALNEDNLNAMSQALDDIDDRVIDLAGTIMEDVPQIIEDMATIEAGLETVGQAVTDAQTAASDADADRLVSEGYAVGKQNGVDVPSTSPYYHNNAKYYSQVAPPTAAVHVSYDHSQSHLAATNVQGAVDELKEALTDEAKTRSALGAKNLLTQNPLTTFTENGVTITKNADGSITVYTEAGGATARVSNVLHDFVVNGNVKDTSLNGKRIILSGCPAGGSSSTYYIQFFKYDGSTVAYDYGEGTGPLDVNVGTTGYVNITMRVESGTVITTPITFKPMIRLATDSDPTYQPYAPTNLQLENNKANKSDLASISITGTTNSTGSTIASGTYFYLNGQLVKAKTSIANGATLTANTNYVVVTAGGLADIGNLLVGVNKKPYTYLASTNNFEFYPEKYSAYIIMAMTSSNTGYGLWYCIRLNDYMVCNRLDYGSYDFVSVTVDTTNKKVTMAGTYAFLVNVIGVFDIA